MRCTMKLNPVCKQYGILLILILQSFFLEAQKKEEKKYPTLLWEITGNGMHKPSYLFGTMHVSSKLVFHLSDSFYIALKNVEMVALELDPQLWQDQLFRYQSMQSNLRFYTHGPPNDYLNEKSFQIEKYEDRLKYALSEEPTIINGLLYRTVEPRADFEEDTYLDLYIYQTGKKLGKLATGVENYFETERLILEAAQDMMKDRKKKNVDMEGESGYEIEKKTQDAYRKGDLDLLDSLERVLMPSEAYMENFLYKRNEMQAHSIDSILKKHSLFVGVGAAHLPGKRGVIELLRKKGYQLRPILMQDRDASQRDEIDKVKVPVNFSLFTSDDLRFTVRIPGKLYKRTDSHIADSWQYADMSNGVYYMITRVKTHSYWLDQKPEIGLRKMDSLLYENIPGKILKKTLLFKDGYKGYQIVNKTRHGDMQRYNILETPFEVLVFKMSGNGNYVEGKEANKFFNSIRLKKNDSRGWKNFEPARGGFCVRLPQSPFKNKNSSGFDGIPRWEYESFDSATGDAYLIYKKSVQNYRFLEEDTINLELMEESFQLSDFVDRQLTRQFETYRGHSSLDATYRFKDGSFCKTKFLVNGPHYYLLSARSNSGYKTFSEFFDSFVFTPYKYNSFKNYTDTFVNISVRTPVVPDIDVNVRNILERASNEDFSNAVPDYNSYWPRNKTALFQDDSTGEAVYVSVQPYPKYYYPKDSSYFWQEETNENKIKEDFIIRNKVFFHFNDSVFGVKYILGDTNSSRLIHSWIFVKDNRLYRIVNLSDSLPSESDFTKGFYESLRPLERKPVSSVFKNKLDIFFQDFYSLDSLTRKKARDAISSIYFGPKGLPVLLNAVRTMPYDDRNYFITKTKLINEIGFIRNSSGIAKEVVSGLKDIYLRAGDTSTFQNAVLKALAKNKTQEAYSLLKVLIIQDPPIFDNPSDYNYLFQDLGDSLPLARNLFPELLELTSIDDYKENIYSLLTRLVDSNFLKANDFENYFSKLLFDAKIQLKKQLGKDERQFQKKTSDNEGSDLNNDPEKSDDENYNELENAAILLMPFFDRNASIPGFFDKMLKSKDGSIRLSTATLMLRYNKTVADSIIQILAASDQYRSQLFGRLETVRKLDQFPAAYKNQIDIARSQLVSSHKSNNFFAVEFVDRKLIHCKLDSGYVYFFKYKINEGEDWQMGISGLQPVNLQEPGSNNDYVKLTGKKLKADQPILEQFNGQLKRLLFSKHKSGVSFYLDNDYYSGRNDEDE
jgi:uncharacterized protein YbaP (TraB family)